MADSGYRSYLQFREYIESNNLKGLDEHYYNNSYCSFENESCHMMWTMCGVGTLEDVQFLLQHSIPRKDSNFVWWAFMVGKMENAELLLKNGFVFNINCIRKNYNKFGTIKYVLKKGFLSFEEVISLNEECKTYFLREKYYRKWRKIYFRNWFRKVVTPLYYSSGFGGGENEKKKLEECFKL